MGLASPSLDCGETDELAKLNTGDREPLKPTAVLNYSGQFDVTPVIGSEFVGVDLAEQLRAPNSDELLRDLAITAGSRLLLQTDGITTDPQEELVQCLGEPTQTGDDLHDRITEPLQGFLDTLTAHYAQPELKDTTDANCCIRVFAVGHYVQKIHGLIDEEFLDWLIHRIVEDHDLRVRHRWLNPDDLVIWRNRSVYLTATSDYIFNNLGERTGSRGVALGETSYFNSQSTTQREAHAAQALDRLSVSILLKCSFAN
ncbi:hypothetical protein DL764_007846 [Monosporascus ibericus]|uniref:TauD/TfdA-like domain-containing protein n=1 Tax=Monosporascus ibericus TaxID=155417 RepID=A0A4Q4SYZ4_9PEZI|nr:hypothetical protein DL764_007846 [Monosporascus ibericus]